MSAIQVKDVPEDIHEQARVRAEELGCTLGEYMLSVLRKDLQRSLRLGWKEELLKRPGIDVDSKFIIETIRAARDGER
ncbi:MAG: hypothetical protein ABIQ38_02930 [Ilumatobacteraceae bacterium]